MKKGLLHAIWIKSLIGALLTLSIGTALPVNAKPYQSKASPRDTTPFLLDIDGANQGTDISPTLFGAFFEDINYAADGGLYAELVQNRSFEFEDATQFWTPVTKGKGVMGSLTIGAVSPLNANNPHYARITVTKKTAEHGGLGIANSGFGGIPVSAGAEYRVSLYARGNDYRGGLKVTLEGESGGVYAAARIPVLTDAWRKYSCELNSNQTDDNARLVVTTGGLGTVDLDMISLFPANTWMHRQNGLRRDLVQLLADLKPKFLRFPGGCIVEGNQLTDAYHWKDSIGDVAERRQNRNLWGMGQTYPYYQTYGLGFYEFFLLCEDLGAEPLPVLNAGMACQVRNGNYTAGQDGRIACSVAQLAESDYVRDAIDLLEFANGPATSVWGGKRAAMGHLEPFRLKYLGIGNENWGHEYQERFKIFREQLLAKSPYAKDIQWIVSSGTQPDGSVFDDTWNWVKSQPGVAAMVDEHFYQEPDWFYQNVNRYDNYDRNGTGVFAGEYAAHEFRRRNIMMGALAEAAFMTGLVKNADVVKMASYAPLFNNVDYTQWLPDLIYFDKTSAYGTPSYYVQKMFSINTGTYTLAASIRDAANHKEVQGPLYGVAAKEAKSGDIIVTMVNTADRDFQVGVLIKNQNKVGLNGTATVLTSGDLLSGNSFRQPMKVVPITTGIKTGPVFAYRLKKYSLTVLRIPSR